jgi:hypothetical protein
MLRTEHDVLGIAGLCDQSILQVIVPRSKGQRLERQATLGRDDHLLVMVVTRPNAFEPIEVSEITGTDVMHNTPAVISPPRCDAGIAIP